MRSPTIVALPSVYNGIRFRSRLEARWAIYLEALGEPWDYEPEGFDLGHYGRYLPDFWLANLFRYAEVKPSSACPADLWTAFRFVEVTHQPLALLCAGDLASRIPVVHEVQPDPAFGEPRHLAPPVPARITYIDLDARCGTGRVAAARAKARNWDFTRTRGAAR